MTTTARRTAGWALALAALALARPSAAGAEECPAGNLVPAARIAGAGASEPVRAAADRYVADEGAPWDSPLAVVLAGPGSFVSADLGAARTLQSLTLQADGDDHYAVDGSLDGSRFFPICRVRPAAGAGLRTRRIDLGGVRTRHLRVAGLGGDGRYSVAELEAECRPETTAGGAHPPVAAQPSLAGRLTPRGARAVKLAVALLAAALFLWGAILRRLGRPGAHAALRDRALAALGVAAALCWWNLGAFHFGNYLHPGEFFHHFLGAKYFRELGYDGLYRCVAAADAEAGLETWVRDRWVRELDGERRLVPGARLLEEAGACRERFSAERWRAFTRDVARLRSWIPPANWERTQQDHGYNASPAWWLAAAPLVGWLPPSGAGALALALIDPLLLLAAFALSARVFGWRAAAVAAIWWGTNLPAEFSWTGGGLLRQDWLLLSVAGVCLVGKGRAAAGGALIAWAAALRVYPVFLAAGLGCKALASMARRRSLAPERGHRRFLAGFAAGAAAVLLASSAAAPRGARSWASFLDNGRALLTAGATNHVGLAPALSFSRDALLRNAGGASFDDRVARWRDAKQRVLGSRRWLQVAAAAAFVGLLLLRAPALEDWEALVLGVGLVPFVVSSSAYYAAVYLLYGLLWVHRRERGALPLAALAASTQALGLALGHPSRQEELFAGVSLALLVAVAWLTAQRPSVAGEARRR